MNVRLHRLVDQPDDIAALQRVLESAPTYAHRVSGHPVGPADAQSLISALPKGVGYDEKFVWGLNVEGHNVEAPMAGVADVIRGWPTPDTALVGLLLLDETHTGRGWGRASYEAVEAEIRSWTGIRQIRIAVVRTNDAVLPFWRRMGFQETGEIRPYSSGQVTSEAIILTKPLV